MIAHRPTNLRNRLDDLEHCLHSLQQQHRSESGPHIGLDLDDPIARKLAGEAYDVMFEIYEKYAGRGDDPWEIADDEDRARMNDAYGKLQEHLERIHEASTQDVGADDENN